MNKSEYRDIIIKATLTKAGSDFGDHRLEIKTPFQRYSEQVFLDGVDVTYSYQTHLEWEGREVIVFTSAIDQHPTLPSEVEKAKTCKEFIADNWDDAAKDETFQTHYTLTKADAITITEKVGEQETVLKYSGADAAKLHKPYGLFATSDVALAAERADISDKAASIEKHEPITEEKLP